MDFITGVDSKGLADNESEITATAVMYTSQVFQNNIKHFFSHLRTSFKALGDTVMILLGHDGQKIDVTQGPEAYMQLQVARQELTSLMGVVDPTQKGAIVNAILRTHPDNEVLAQLYAELNSMPQPTQNEIQLQQLVETMKKAIEDKDAEILQLTSQVEAYQRSDKSQDKSHIYELQKMKLNHEYSMEDEILKARLEQGLDAERTAIDAEKDLVKTEADARKAALDLEAKNVALETQKIKSASEIMKTVGGNV